jgi:hypothetical protein
VIAVIGKAGKSKVIEQAHRNDDPKAARVPEARYSYYRRCQLFRRNGEQCKAPAEKGSAICHAHAAQVTMALRRERERQAVLAEAVALMRRQGGPNFEMADLFTDLKGIQVTLAVMAQALIDGRIDCKTAGRLVVHLQTMSKLLRMVHRKGREGRKENRVVPQICADERRSEVVQGLSESKRTSTETQIHGEQQSSPQVCADERRLEVVQGLAESKRTSTTETRRHGEQQGSPQVWADERRSGRQGKLQRWDVMQPLLTSAIGRDIHGEDSRFAFAAKVRTFPERRQGCRDGPLQTRAA